MQKLDGVLQNFFNQAQAKGRLRRECFGDLVYHRLIDDSQPFRRGTVIFKEGTLIPGYPQIGRMVRLDKGLKEQFTKPFWAEERVDGYKKDIQLFIFNCQRKGEFDYLSQADKDQLMEHYSLPSVRNFGCFKAEYLL